MWIVEISKLYHFIEIRILNLRLSKLRIWKWIYFLSLVAPPAASFSFKFVAFKEWKFDELL